MAEHGVPADVIEQMTDLQKEYLCEMLPDNAEFESYSSQKYMMADDDSLVATYGQISASDLTMSVVACPSLTEIFLYHFQYQLESDRFLLLLTEQMMWIRWQVFSPSDSI